MLTRLSLTTAPVLVLTAVGLSVGVGPAAADPLPVPVPLPTLVQTLVGPLLPTPAPAPVVPVLSQPQPSPAAAPLPPRTSPRLVPAVRSKNAVAPIAATTTSPHRGYAVSPQLPMRGLAAGVTLSGPLSPAAPLLAARPTTALPTPVPAPAPPAVIATAAGTAPASVPGAVTALALAVLAAAAGSQVYARRIR